MKNPLISIVIPCYNHGQFIDEAIESIEACNNQEYEIIIVNDGSTDSYTNNRLEELKSNGYNILFQTNQGLGKTRNNGIKIAKGKYILPLDSDNKINQDFIGKAIAVLESNQSISIVYSDRQLFGDSNECIRVGEFSLQQILKGNYIDACAIYRKVLWDEIGGYDENMPIQGWEDWDFWLSAGEKEFQFYYIPEPLFHYRVLENSMIKQLINNPNLQSLEEYVYRKHTRIFVKEYRRINSELISLYSELNQLNNDNNRMKYERNHPTFRNLIRSIYKFLFN